MGRDTIFSGSDAAGRSEAASRGAAKAAIQVRLVEARDWPALRVLVRRQHERTRFGDMPFSDKKFDVLEQRLRASRNECLIAAEYKDGLIGAAWASAGEYLLSEDSLTTTVHLITVDRQKCGAYLSAKAFVRLMRGVALWSRSIGAGRTLIHVTTGADIKATDRLLRAGGAECIGGGYVLAG